MGTDFVRLLDKVLSDRLLAMDREALGGFLEEHVPRLEGARRDRASLLVDELTSAHGSGARALTALLHGSSMDDLRVSLIDDLCWEPAEIAIDYWGCFAEVFSGSPPEGAISSKDYLPGQIEEVFRLLLPEHVDRMLASLARHRSEVRIMDDKAIRRLQGWRDRSRDDPRWWVGYFFDV